ncbi:phosphotransferase family protein [Deinococcus misasensis]|uniref:phosphotransferase family protein n=1 Tax=Deinococcus misasensis TaxID=392413 RepID=UPI00054EEC10|nr:aminoglycoside phosphotransferase family protein [Deinococcus misasensis]
MKDLERLLQDMLGPEVKLLESSTFSSGMAFPIHNVTWEQHGVQTQGVLKRYPPGFEEHFFRESWALGHLNELGVAVPDLLGAFQDNSGSSVLMELIEGRPIMEVLSGSDQTLWLERFVKQLIQIHQIEAKQTPQSILLSESAFESLISRFDRPFQKEHQQTFDWLRKQDVQSVTRVLLHQDYHPWNVLLTPENQLVVLDWDWSTGDPRQDVAWTRLILQKSQQPELCEAFTAQYGQQNPESTDHLEVFDVLAHLRWLQLLEQPSAKSKSTPEIQRWIEQLKQESFQRILEISGIPMAKNKPPSPE